MSPEQLIIIGLAASVITQIFKFLFDMFAIKPSGLAQMIILFVVSLVLALVFTAPELPPISDPMALALALIELASGVVGFAALIYKILLEKVVFPAIRLG